MFRKYFLSFSFASAEYLMLVLYYCHFFIIDELWAASWWAEAVWSSERLLESDWHRRGRVQRHRLSVWLARPAYLPFYLFCFCFLWRESSERGRKHVCVNPDRGCRSPSADRVFMSSSSAFIQAPSGWSERWNPLHCWNVLLAQGEHVGDHALFALQDLSNRSAVTLRQHRLTCSVGMGCAERADSAWRGDGHISAFICLHVFT